MADGEINSSRSVPLDLNQGSFVWGWWYSPVGPSGGGCPLPGGSSTQAARC